MNEKFEIPEELFEEKEFNRLVSFSKNLGDESGVSAGLLDDTLDDRQLPLAFGDYQLTRVLEEDQLCQSFVATLGGVNHKLVLRRFHTSVVRRFSDEEFEKNIKRFHRDSMAAASIAPEFVVPVIEFGDIDGRYFYVTDRIKGKTLAKLTNSNAFSNRLSAEIVKSIAGSAHKLHRAGVFTGHIHPAMIILDNLQRPHLVESSPALSRMMDKSAPDDSFKAPEVSDRNDLNALAEVWAMGAILYLCLVGESPPKNFDLPRKRNPKVARDLEAICLKCLKQNPDKRYQNAAELAEDLDLFLEYQPVKAAPEGFVGKLLKGLEKFA